nr:cytochrome c1 [uncultured Acidocella sp.]
MRVLLISGLALGLLAGGAAQAQTPSFSSSGAFGHIDDAAAQRGLAVYQGVCASCHSLNQLHYRDLAGIGLDAEQIAGLANAVKLATGQPATADDVFKAPAAMSMGGAVPPDLSSIVAQRRDGTRYIYRFLTGFAPAPAGVTMLPGHYYNRAYPGGQVAMPPVLRDNAVTYADGTKATQAQEAADVAEFLTWASDPNLTARHVLGIRAGIFFAFLTLVALATKRRIWKQEG